MKKSSRPGHALFLIAIAMAASGHAQTEAPVDKSQFHLFNPTPTKHLREFTTDRPDKTESPYTVDAGHFQLEMDVVNYTSDHETIGGAPHRVAGWAIAPINLKAGICNRLDAQLVLQTYNYVDEHADKNRTKRSGYGDTLFRLKYNFWGNDGGKTAFGALPFVKFPTSQDRLGNHSYEGGLILPLAVQLPMGFGMGFMTEIDAARDEDESGYHGEFINSITLNHDLVGRLSGYVEFFSAVSAERGAAWVGTFDVGFTYGLGANVQFDTGVNIGMTRSAPDWNPFLGVSWRF